MLINDDKYIEILGDIKSRVMTAQRNAVLNVNSELINLYWNIGKIINEKSVWGNKFVENLERDLRIEFPKYKGFSARNLRLHGQIRGYISRRANFAAGGCKITLVAQYRYSRHGKDGGRAQLVFIGNP